MMSSKLRKVAEAATNLGPQSLEPLFLSLSMWTSSIMVSFRFKHFVDFDNICPATLLHDSVTLVEVFGVVGTSAGEVVSAQQAADEPHVLTRVIHITLVLR